MNYKLGDINKHLNVTMTTNFVEKTLGVPRDGQEKRSVLFNEDSYIAICRAAAAHFSTMAETVPTALPPRPKPPKASGQETSASSPDTSGSSFDDEEEL